MKIQLKKTPEEIPLYLDSKTSNFICRITLSLFISDFRNYYCEDLIVILFTLTNPSKLLNTCFKGEIANLRQFFATEIFFKSDEQGKSLALSLSG